MTMPPLPPLPAPEKVYSNKWGDGSDATYWHSPYQLRTVQREAAIWALEEAAKLCDAVAKNKLNMTSDCYTDCIAAAEECAAAIRARKEMT